jgi:hypothetical protein
VHIWLDPGVLARLKALRGPGESYSGVIIRLAKGDARLGMKGCRDTAGLSAMALDQTGLSCPIKTAI